MSVFISDKDTAIFNFFIILQLVGIGKPEKNDRNFRLFLEKWKNTTFNFCMSPSRLMGSWLFGDNINSFFARRLIAFSIWTSSEHFPPLPVHLNPAALVPDNFLNITSLTSMAVLFNFRFCFQTQSQTSRSHTSGDRIPRARERLFFIAAPSFKWVMWSIITARNGN